MDAEEFKKYIVEMVKHHGSGTITCHVIDELFPLQHLLDSSVPGGTKIYTSHLQAIKYFADNGINLQPENILAWEYELTLKEEVDVSNNREPISEAPSERVQRRDGA